MKKFIAVLLGIPILLISCSTGALMPIRTCSINHAERTDYLQWKTEAGFWLQPTEHYSTSASFIRDFSNYARFLPFPAAIWAVEGTRGGSGFSKAEEITYAEALQTISSWAGPYAVFRHPGFIEIAWGDAPQAKAIREKMTRRVPPIIFQSRNAADFLSMWHDVSGMEFRYDPAVVTKCMKYDAARLAEESDPDLPLMKLPKNPFPTAFARFTSDKEMPIAEFMSRLAAHVGGLARRTLRGWVIEDFQRNQQGLELIHNCFAALRKNMFDPEPIEILGRLGSPALPEILDELQPYHAERDIDEQILKHGLLSNSYIQRSLVQAVARISSPQRDAALIKLLMHRQYDISIDLMEILAASNCQKAIPVIEGIEKSSNSEMHIAARIALNALGKPWTAPEPEKKIELADSARNSPDTEQLMEALPLLQAVLAQCDQYKIGMQINSIAVDNAKGIVIRGTSGEDHPSSWNFLIPVLHKDQAMFRYNLFSVGYIGKLNKVGNRWLVTRWRKEWMS